MVKLPKSQTPLARRIDAIVRAEYPFAKTELHEISMHSHVIYAPENQIPEADFKDHFDRSITPAAWDIQFSNTRPSNSTIIEPIEEANWISDQEGMIHTRSQLRVALEAKHPEIPRLAASNINEDGSITFYFADEIPCQFYDEIFKFLDFHMPCRRVNIEVRKHEIGETTKQITDNQGIDFKPISARGALPDFVKKDEIWWYENIDGIYQGYVTKNSILSKKYEGSSCFINGTWPNIDIRQALLAFDTIYLQPPFSSSEKPKHNFWEQQRISKEDLLYLVEVDRVRLIQRQPEERCDIALLTEAYERNPDGVLSRRKSAGYVLADMVQTDMDYLLSDNDLELAIPALIESYALAFNVSKGYAAKSVLFPKYARRNWAMSFFDRGAKGIEPNGIGGIFADIVKETNGLDYRVESWSFGEDVHLAHALNATLLSHLSIGQNGFAEAWYLPMKIMGDKLNFYRSFNGRTASTWVGHQEDRRNAQSPILPPVPLFNFEAAAPMKDIVDFTSYGSDREKGRSLISRLSDMPEDLRAEEVERISKELYELQSQKDRFAKGMSFLEIGSEFLGNTILGPVTAGWKLYQHIIEVARRSPKLDKVIDHLETAIKPINGQNEDLTFLSKVHRVARLKNG